MKPTEPHDSRNSAAEPLTVLVAMGPTREPLDAVRYLGNRSSGRMGAAIVAACAEAGCAVTAAVGPGAVAPVGARRVVSFGTAAELLALLAREWPQHDLLIMAAAVADFSPAAPAKGKLRRGAGGTTLHLEPTPDILASLAAATRPSQFVVGFALEPAESLEDSARDKLSRKRADAIVANPLETMDSSTVRARVLLADGSWHAPAGGAEIRKEEFARWLVGLLAPRAEARRKTAAAS